MTTILEQGEAQAIADAFGVSTDALRIRDRSKTMGEARNAWCWLLRNRGLSWHEIGRVCGVDYSTARFRALRAESMGRTHAKFRKKISIAMKKLVDGGASPA